MKTILLFLSIAFSILSQAQVPLLPLFGDVTIKWQGQDVFYSICASTTSYQGVFNHEIVGESIMDGKVFSIVRTYRKYVSSSLCVPVGGLYKTEIHQSGNMFLVKRNQKVDTSLFFLGTEIGSSVTGSSLGDNSVKINKIDTVEIQGSRCRRFYLRSESNPSLNFIYLDGIGFLHLGPPLFLYDREQTNSFFNVSYVGYSFLTCYQHNMRSNVLNLKRVRRNVQGTDEYFDIDYVTSSTTTCFTPLYLKTRDDIKDVKIFVRANKELITSINTIKVEIYGSDGRKILDNHDSNITDISALSSGIYIARIAFASGVASYRFLKEE